MKFSQSALLIGSATFAAFADAAHMPLSGHTTPRATLARRSNLSGTSGLTFNGNGIDVEYLTNITLAGKQYTVLVDTGSADLWVSGGDIPTEGVNNTGKTAAVLYSGGEAEGPILLADLEFSGYKVEQQAFFFADDSKPLPAPGIIGLGPWQLSSITMTLTTSKNNMQGLPPVDEIFVQNKATPNYITILLGRSDDPDNKFPGDLTIAELLPGYEDVINQPKLTVQDAKFGNQHWSILIDEDGIIGSDGEAISVETIVSSTRNDAQLTAMFDTGFTLPQVPAVVAEGFYSKIEGAKLENVTGLGEAWTLDCDKEVNITFKIGGKTYPIHPLDAIIDPVDISASLSSGRCIGSFMPIPDPTADPDVDMILGMAVLRNMYLYVNYGDFVPMAQSHSRTSPYLQLLSVSNNTAEMHEDFVQVRMKGNDTTGSQGLLAENLSSSKTSKVKTTAKKIAKAVIIGIAVAAVVALLLVGLCCFCLCRRRSSSKRAPSAVWSGQQSYQSLNAPAPAAVTDMHMYDGPYSYAPPPSTGYLPPTGYQAHPTGYQPPTSYQPPYQPNSTTPYSQPQY